MEDINWLAVLLAAVSAFALGALWYGPLFGKMWMQLTGMTEEKAREANMPLIFGMAFLLELAAAMALAMLIGQGADLTLAVAAAIAVGLFWVATSIGVIYLFERRSLRHWMIDAGYHVFAFAIMGVIIGVWR